MDKMDEFIYLLEVGSVPRSYTVENYLHNVFSFPSTIAILLTKDNLFKCTHFKAKQVFIFMSELLVSQFFYLKTIFLYCCTRKADFLSIWGSTDTLSLQLNSYCFILSSLLLRVVFVLFNLSLSVCASCQGPQEEVIRQLKE